MSQNMPSLVADSLPRSKSEARRSGASRYFTGRPCPQGHVAPRYTGGGCTECERQASAKRTASRPGWNTAKSKRYAEQLREADPRSFWLRAALRNARVRAERDGLACTITRADLWPLMVDNCPALGIPLVYGTDVRCAGSASVDKIVPALGYVPGNIAVISWRANTIKHNATPDELAAVAAWSRKQAR